MDAPAAGRGGHPDPIREAGSPSERLVYIDNLRTLIVTFVVMHHLAVTISGYGSWYYTESVNLDPLSVVWFAFYLSFQQGYFMGLMFLIAGYFAAASYDRKGFGGFLGGRFRRLVIPALIYMVLVTPFIGLVELGSRPSSYGLADFLSGTGVMWFTAALFAFSLVYAVLRRRGSGFANSPGSGSGPPSLRGVVAVIFGIAALAFLIRTVQPIGTDVLNFQISFFASYSVLFAVGAVAYRRNLLNRVTYRAGKRWLLAGIVLGFFAWLVLVSAAAKAGGTTALAGGLTWESAGYSIWESFVAVAMSIGLIAVFREKFNRQGKLARTLSDNSFAVYMFHPVVLVPVALLMSPLAIYPIAKWLLLCVICVPLCFVAAHFFFRRIPLLKDVL